jgi:hypothetical protein
MGLEFDGVNGIIKNTTSDGDVTIKGNDGGSEISLLTFDVSAEGVATFNKDIKIGDSGKALFGAGSDLQIYHDGTNSYIQDEGTGDLKITSNGNAISFQKGTSETMAFFDTDAGCELYHNNVKKLETTSAGIAITGGFTATDGCTITTNDTSDTLTLVSGDTGSTSAPNLLFNRNSSSPAANDFLGSIDFQGKNSAGDDHNYIRILSRILSPTDGSETADLVFKDALGTNILNMTASEVVFNDDSVDRDFRVESDGVGHMLFVDAGNNRVGIATSSPTRTFTVGNDGIIGLEGSSNALAFTESSSLKAYIASQSFGDHNGDGLGIVTSGDEPVKFHVNGTETFRIDTTHSGPHSGKFSTFGESAPDCGDGGMTLQQGSNDDRILTFKSTDVAHGMTDGAETDTYAVFKKQSATLGGLQIRSFAENNANERLVINVSGDGDVTESTSTSTKGAMCITSANKSGTGESNQNANGNILSIANHATTRFLFEGNGEFHADASSNTFDEFEDAHLVRAYDLSHGRGVINSKFDKFVAYNHEKLADLRLVGREDDGTPNHFVNVTGMQRLHNGAIWQQYEKHEKLASAFYKLAKKTIGKEEADKLLTEEEIQLLN